MRVTLAFDREVPFSTERLDRPPRLAVDFPDTRVVYALKDTRLTWPEGLVRGIRVVRTDAARMRVLVDLDAAARYSIYPMYGPYRLVIDVSRSRPGTPTATKVTEAAAPTTPANPPAVRVPAPARAAGTAAPGPTPAAPASPRMGA